jgi:hypothetical protein
VGTVGRRRHRELVEVGVAVVGQHVDVDGLAGVGHGQVGLGRWADVANRERDRLLNRFGDAIVEGEDERVDAGVVGDRRVEHGDLTLAGPAERGTHRFGNRTERPVLGWRGQCDGERIAVRLDDRDGEGGRPDRSVRSGRSR